VDGESTDAFFTAASAGRRWRAAPTDVLATLAGGPHAAPYAEALAAVARAGANLGTPRLDVAARASATAAVQLAAASTRPAPAPAASIAAEPTRQLVDDLLRQLTPSPEHGLTALRPDQRQPDVPSLDGILTALHRGG